jgi:hypothetical protein
MDAIDVAVASSVGRRLELFESVRQRLTEMNQLLDDCTTS